MKKYYYRKLIDSIKWIDSIRWYEKLILKFKRMKYKTIQEGFDEIQIGYKKLFNKTFILKRTILLPRHINCRCEVKIK